MEERKGVRDLFFATIRGGLIGLLGAAILLIIFWFGAFMVAFGNPGPFADAYLAMAAFFLSGIVPALVLVVGYLAGAFCIRPSVSNEDGGRMH